MKPKKKLIHAQILLSKHPECSPLRLDMEILVAHWRTGLVEGEIREPMHTLFVCEDSFVAMLAFLKSYKKDG
jgi:hypothetical protein